MKKFALILVLALIGFGASAQTNTFPSSGNVGIGLVSPEAKLHIDDSGSSPMTLLILRQTLARAVGNQYGVEFRDNANEVNAAISVVHGALNNQGNLVFGTNNGTGGNGFSNATEWMRITSGGNVGIGTTNPSEKLSVAGNLFLTGLRSEIYGTDRNHMIVLRGRQDGTVIDETNYYQYGDHVFNTGGVVSSQTEKMRIKANGNVGIGNSNPLFNMDVAGGIRAGAANPGGAMLVLADDATFYDDQSGNTRLRMTYGGNLQIDNGGLTTTGNVLIGKTTQSNTSYKLDVAGNIRANKLVVNTTGADYVFDSSYRLAPLTEVETFINQNKHLPGIEPAKQMSEEGVDVGNNQTKLLQKIEELTLYMIEIKKENEQMKKENEKQQKEIDALKKKQTK